MGVWAGVRAGDGQYPTISGVFQTFNTGHEPQHITCLVPPSNPNNQSRILFAYYVSTCLLVLERRPSLTTGTTHVIPAMSHNTLPALCHHQIQTIVKLVKSWPSGMPLCTHTHALHGPAPPHHLLSQPTQRGRLRRYNVVMENACWVCKVSLKVVTTTGKSYCRCSRCPNCNKPIAYFKRSGLHTTIKTPDAAYQTAGCCGSVKTHAGSTTTWCLHGR